MLEQNLGSRGQKDEPPPDMLITFEATAQPACDLHTLQVPTAALAVMAEDGDVINPPRISTIRCEVLGLFVSFND